MKKTLSLILTLLLVACVAVTVVSCEKKRRNRFAYIGKRYR